MLESLILLIGMSIGPEVKVVVLMMRRISVVSYPYKSLSKAPAVQGKVIHKIKKVDP